MFLICIQRADPLDHRIIDGMAEVQRGDGRSAQSREKQTHARFATSLTYALAAFPIRLPIDLNHTFKTQSTLTGPRPHKTDPIRNPTRYNWRPLCHCEEQLLTIQRVAFLKPRLTKHPDTHTRCLQTPHSSVGTSTN